MNHQSTRREALGSFLGVSLLFLTSCQAADERASGANESTPSKVLACPDGDPAAVKVPAVVAAAERFLDTLTPTRRASVVNQFTPQNAIRWSNLPPAIVSRAGVSFDELDDEQTSAANALVLAAAGRCGFEAFDGDRAADGVAHTVVDYIRPGFHYISFNGEPSETEPWMLMVGGHHLAYNIVMNGRMPGATPLLIGSDPARFVDQSGREREPLERQRIALTALAGAVQDKPGARLPGNHPDLEKSVTPIDWALPGLPPRAPRPPLPGSPRESAATQWDRANRTRDAIGDGRIAGTDLGFPHTYPSGSTGRGVAYALLHADEQALVHQVIEAFVALTAHRNSVPLLQAYQAPDALAATYTAVTGDSQLIRPNGYLRIDGPRVWIEVSAQSSLFDSNVIHFHAVWRDKVADYGGQLSQ